LSDGDPLESTHIFPMPSADPVERAVLQLLGEKVLAMQEEEVLGYLAAALASVVEAAPQEDAENVEIFVESVLAIVDVDVAAAAVAATVSRLRSGAAEATVSAAASDADAVAAAAAATAGVTTSCLPAGAKIPHREPELELPVTAVATAAVAEAAAATAAAAAVAATAAQPPPPATAAEAAVVAMVGPELQGREEECLGCSLVPLSACLSSMATHTCTRDRWDGLAGT
jgi:hypothetical protein